MRWPGRPGVLAALVALTAVTGAVSGVSGTDASAPGPAPRDELNGLSPRERATLFSRDPDRFVSPAAFRDRFGRNRSPAATVANATDIAFARPPGTAATWTRNDFRDLPRTGPDRVVYPPHANRTDGRFVRDAHATVFAVHPSTKAHRGRGRTPWYVAPEAAVRGLVDYRVAVPNTTRGNGTVVRWRLANASVTTVRLLVNGRPVARTDRTQRPVLNLSGVAPGPAALTLEATIRVRLVKVVRSGPPDDPGDPEAPGAPSRGPSDDAPSAAETGPPAPPGNGTGRAVGNVTETVTVRDTLDAVVYRPTATRYTTRYPGGDRGVAIVADGPWQGLRVGPQGGVRGVWRFYTARDTRWDRLVTSNGTATTTARSPALPVYVHAFPSRIGPKATPPRDGPRLLEVWGQRRPPPTLGANVSVGVVADPYLASYGLAARVPALNASRLRVRGLVRTVRLAQERPADAATRQLRRANLTVTILEATGDQARIRIELRDATTGEPIVLQRDQRFAPISGDRRTGSITVADRRVYTNGSGVAVVTLAEPGVYTVRYEPGSWLTHDPAYTPARTAVKWHPLARPDGWAALLGRLAELAVPLVVVYLAARWLLRTVVGPPSDRR